LLKKGVGLFLWVMTAVWALLARSDTDALIIQELYAQFRDRKMVSNRNSLSFLDNNRSPLLSALNRLMCSSLIHLN
jgi:hypothetical protein